MRKLVEFTFITLDGVISDPRAWGQPYWDAEHDAYNGRLMERAGALLLGRETLLDNVLNSPAHLKVADRNNFSSGIPVLTLVPRNQV